MLRRFAAIAGSTILNCLLFAWLLARLILDNAGRADVVSTLGASTSIFVRAAAWLLNTPWEVPAFLAATVTGGWLYLAYRLMTPMPVIIKPKVPALGQALDQKRYPKVAPAFSKTFLSDHDLNVLELVNQTPIEDLQKKIDALDFLSSSYEEFVSLTLDIKHLSVGRNVYQTVERARALIQQMQSFRLKLHTNFHKCAASNDVVACFSLWGFEEMLHSLSEMITVADNAKPLPVENYKEIVTPYIENVMTLAISFSRWREETGHNLTEFRSDLNRRIVKINDS